ncbi:hypothetical protein NSE_0221 [Neorickettsia sennetsu str. Miyayama]|uniref:Uncharacterized protein n=1 Tax=Ehrlichia sennetsu (strain ATCC VR-367 / Miyayama) TaxID=222891 RepID=Q2GEI0_EHRS3|nr:hypothetical protein NSE_0221 [Neorickettsia sennetsu str. Miyayama]
MYIDLRKNAFISILLMFSYLVAFMRLLYKLSCY